MILIGLGANLPSNKFGEPEKTLLGIIGYLNNSGIKVLSKARIYKSAPVPISDDPWFFNTVINVQTSLTPCSLMRMLLDTEVKFGRKSSLVNAPRIIDIDLLDYEGLVVKESSEIFGLDLVLPHPRMDSRAFVMLPLLELAPNWSHPISGLSIQNLIENLDPSQNIVVLG